MSKRKLESISNGSRKRVSLKFKVEWLDVIVMTPIPTFRDIKPVKLNEIFDYIEEQDTVKCVQK